MAGRVWMQTLILRTMVSLVLEKGRLCFQTESEIDHVDARMEGKRQKEQVGKIELIASSGLREGQWETEAVGTDEDGVHRFLVFSRLDAKGDLPEGIGRRRAVSGTRHGLLVVLAVDIQLAQTLQAGSILGEELDRGVLEVAIGVAVDDDAHALEKSLVDQKLDGAAMDRVKVHLGPSYMDRVVQGEVASVDQDRRDSTHVVIWDRDVLRQSVGRTLSPPRQHESSTSAVAVWVQHLVGFPIQIRCSCAWVLQGALKRVSADERSAREGD